MSAPTKSEPTAGAGSNRDALADARARAHANLGAAAHYIRCAQMHLEIEDDGGAIWDLQHFREYARRAIGDFKPCRDAFAHRVANGDA